MRNYVKEALILAVAIIALGVIIYSAAIAFRDKDRVVSVRGLAEMEVPANKVIWPISYAETGNDIPTLYKIVSEKNAVILKFLKDNGLADSEITASAPSVSDMEVDGGYSTNNKFRYSMSSIVTVATDKVDLVRKLVLKQAELIGRGIAINGNSYVDFEYTDLNKIKPKMIEEATRNARAAAQKFAKDSDSKLGKIRSAVQGQFSIDNRDQNTPYIKNVRVVTVVNFALED
ncbi:MAG: SIMPL domain-containing protein [Fibrobacteraceae bacterium]